MLRYTVLGVALALAIVAIPKAVGAQDTGAMSDADYIAKVSAAAPPAVVKGATIVQANKDGSMRVLQKGTNGFTCMMLDATDSMCADKNAMAWGAAMMKNATPPDAVGFAYMLGGDEGASNTDPMARAATPTNHWIKTGPHVMIVGPSVKTMGYPMTPDADPTKPYVMWANTPYAHLMIPVATTSP